MLISNYNRVELKRLLSKNELLFNLGPFSISLTSSVPLVFDHINALYRNYHVMEDNGYVDYFIDVSPPNPLRKWFRPQINFAFDQFNPFVPLPLAQAAAQFEWGLNWCVANNAHQYLIVHSAVVEKNGKGLILPGTPGSGKSTLCAALISKGWRLLSDEMALISIKDGLVHPIPRPVSLKNQSIDIIKQFNPDALFGEVIKNTSKGDLAHMKAPDESVALTHQCVKLDYLVFPHYKANSTAELTDLSKAKACMLLIDQTFNFNILGGTGFKSITRAIDDMACYDFVYPDLETALKGIDSLVE